MKLIEPRIGRTPHELKFFNMTNIRSPARHARSGTEWPASPASNSSARGKTQTRCTVRW